MREAFARVLTLEQVEQRYGGVEDPADAALAAAPAAGATPAEVNAWWGGLTRGQQRAIIAASPGSIGNRDGIPPGARDAANTVALDRDLAEWGFLEDRGLLTADEERWLENARAARDARRAIEQGIDPVDRRADRQPALHLRPDRLRRRRRGGRVAPATSPPPTTWPSSCRASAPTAPARRTTAERVLLPLRGRPGPSTAGQTNASMFWIGYDAPDNTPWSGGWDAAGVIDEDLATRGGDGWRTRSTACAPHATGIPPTSR